MKAVGLSFVREVRFHPPRRWRFDFVVKPKWYVEGPLRARDCLAVEVEGGTWVQGRHNRGASFEADAIKYAEALIDGFRVMRVTTAMVDDGRALALIERALAATS